jgi:hypothetical protein
MKKKKRRKKNHLLILSFFFSYTHFVFLDERIKKSRTSVFTHNHISSKDVIIFIESMLDIMDTYNHNNIPHRYDKYTNQKDSSKYTKKVIMRKMFFCS